MENIYQYISIVEQLGNNPKNLKNYKNLPIEKQIALDSIFQCYEVNQEFLR